MEPGVAAAAYGVETVAVAQPTMPIKARWTRIPAIQSLPRTSHSLSIVKGRAYIFGGEIVPRRPVDNEMHIITLPSSGVAEADYQVISGKDVDAPSSRFGHIATIISDRIFIFGGRRLQRGAGRLCVYQMLPWRTGNWTTQDLEVGLHLHRPIWTKLALSYGGD